MGCQRYASCALPPGKKPCAHCTEGLCWPHSRSGLVRKILLTLRLDPRTVQLIASGYTNRAIPANEKYASSVYFRNIVYHWLVSIHRKQEFQVSSRNPPVVSFRFHVTKPCLLLTITLTQDETSVFCTAALLFN